MAEGRRERKKPPIVISYRALRVLDAARRYAELGLGKAGDPKLYEKFCRAEDRLTRSAVLLVLDDRKRLAALAKKKVKRG